MPNQLNKNKNKLKDKDKVRTTQGDLILAQQAKCRRRFQKIAADGRRSIVGRDSTAGGVGGRSTGGVFEFVFAKGRESSRKRIDSHGSEWRRSKNVK